MLSRTDLGAPSSKQSPRHSALNCCAESSDRIPTFMTDTSPRPSIEWPSRNRVSTHVACSRYQVRGTTDDGSRTMTEARAQTSGNSMMFLHQRQTLDGTRTIGCPIWVRRKPRSPELHRRTRLCSSSHCLISISSRFEPSELILDLSDF